MIQIPVDVEMPPYTVDQIVARLNEVAGYPKGVRAALERQCRERGHVPTGEQILTAHPLDCCFRCAQLYEAPA